MPGEKGSYRSVYSSIWDDPEFQEFEPLTQTVFFCLRTSKDCNFPCIFIHYHTSLYGRIPNASKDAIDASIAALSDADWIRYERPILWIVKGLKNEPNYYPQNSKHISGIANIMKSLPKLKIVEDFAAYYSIPLDYDAPEKPKKPKVEANAPEKKAKFEDILPVREIIEYLNLKSGKNFAYTSRATKSHIAARWKEGFGLDDFKKVINHQCAKWIGDPKMEEYIRPQTLFNGEKFESYLNAPPPTANGATDTAGRALGNLGGDEAF